MVKYTAELKRKVVKHYLEGLMGYRLIAAHYKIAAPIIKRWVAAYRLHGEESLCRRYTSYSAEFKLSVLEHMWDNALSNNQVAAVFNIPNPSSIRSWERRYQDGGSKALAHLKKSTSDMPVPPLQPERNPEARPLQELTHEQLLARAEHLQMEVAVLKKLQALTQAKRAATLKKRK